MSEPEWTQRGKSFGMWRDDKAADDQAKQEPGSSSGKEMAKGFKHLVQVKQSRHTVPLLNGVIRETYRMSAPSNWPPPSACWAECRVLRRGTSELTTQEITTKLDFIHFPQFEAQYRQRNSMSPSSRQDGQPCFLCLIPFSASFPSLCPSFHDPFGNMPKSYSPGPSSPPVRG